jgi:ribosome-associated toxin RatA of RatAB toxin-antitoxin module
MTTVSRSAIVPYSAAAMFELVDDVNAYQQFLPWVKRSTEHFRDDDQVKATLIFSKGGFEKSFTTLNRRYHGEMIDIRLVEGPFRHLEGIWRFEPSEGGGSKVSLDLEFEFASRLLSMAFGRVFTQVATTLVDSFVRRADSVYEKPGVSR